MKTHNTLKKTVLTLASATCLAISSFGINAWLEVSGPDMPPPNYKVEIVNNSTFDVNLAGSAHLLNVPGLPGSLVVGLPAQVLDFVEADMQNLVLSLDNESQFHDLNSAYWNWCSGMQWQDPIHLDFMVTLPDTVDPTINRCFMVHVEFCMQQKCSSISTSIYSGSEGYVKISFTDATA